jgi:glycosyltransferase involved in cell wall biosynthesis
MSLRRLGLAPLRILQEAGIPFVLTVNDDWPVAYGTGPAPGWRGRLGGWIDAVLVPARTWEGISAAGVLYLSESVRRAVREAGVPLAPGRVQPQGVDLSLFTPRPFRPMRPEPRLLFVGRLHPSKGPEVTLDALAALRRREIPATLTLVGEAHDPAYHAALARRAHELRIEHAVTWAGKVARERLPGLYREADALLFVSRLEHEGQGLTYLEAMACGLLVVAWPCGGAREFLERHGAACLAASCSGEALADAITSLRDDPAAQEALTARALEIVREHASLESYARSLEVELRQAARSTPPLPWES